MNYIFRGGLNSTCAEGFSGILCHDCIGESNDGYYARTGISGCSLCKSMSVESLKIVGFLIAICVYIAVMSM
jgi:hypothetical protein